MTFLEAAVEVLRRAGKPLPVREIAMLAIRHELLTHVGRDPEGTMKARLEAELLRPPSLARVRAVRPEVFGLTEVGASAPQRDEPAPPSPSSPPSKTGERRRRRKGKTAAEVAVTPKADAPEPIDSPSPPATEASTADEKGGAEARGRRRRRRGGRRAKSNAEERPPEASTQSASSQEAKPTNVPETPEVSEASAEAKPPRTSPPKTAARTAAESSEGEGPLLADAAFRILREHGDKRPMHYRQIAEMAAKRKLLPADLKEPRAAIRAALLFDQRVHRKAGLRPRFSGGEGGLFSLTGAKLGEGVADAEEGVAQAARRLNDRTREALLARLREAPPEAAEQLLRLALAQRGGQEPTIVERQPGFVVIRGRGAEAGTVVRLQPSALDDATVSAFGGRCGREAARGVLVTLADVPRALAARGQAAGVQVLGGPEFCGFLAKEGVGVFRAVLTVNYLDEELLGGLIEP